ncbi:MULTISPECIES: hypothetical protein [unclassified Curtobacterium]|jgi:hypothetical protein|uniref:hypothetical protein n=1 Tax=unclassified Curtobacterium TaxID=257496 RepID=UPI0008DDAED5|nr:MULTISPECIES: hypothetical protein [unclassified Curtobacterium]MCT9621834.1 hypothetical protein [Curtobacterium sp. C2H10]MDR6169206.1 hypothetical protein [Curtobacterium sp. SORGH_AS_0776]OII21201.1 hypothetical protein BIV03_15275 [Curtobacterium sp. MCBA15_016]OII25795.1 hypothetical protein BIV01_10065 [Curtobacterium sp. MCBA15_013]SFF49812.1 hypothetical protein SAMN05216329_0985 [Curtobacterium sp. YR515]
MPESHDFFVAAAPDHVRALVRGALVREGYTVDDGDQGALRATRGSMGLTLLIGGMANDRTFHTRLDVQIMVTPDGRTVARLLRGAGKSALKGGALGISRGNRAFEQAANAIHGELAQAGILTESVPG